MEAISIWSGWLATTAIVLAAPATPGGDFF